MAISNPRQHERTALGGQLLRGQQVLLDASMVGDRDDLTVWRRNRDAWQEDARRALTSFFPPEAVREFDHATRPTGTGGDSWASHETEIQSVESGLEVITLLRETLQLP
jgi:hypothetical protein